MAWGKEYGVSLCPTCKGSFTKMAWNQKYCCPYCNRVANGLVRPNNRLSDGEYALRVAIRNKCKVKRLSKCELCSSTKQLERHHISYCPELVVTLCKPCHTKAGF